MPSYIRTLWGTDIYWVIEINKTVRKRLKTFGKFHTCEWILKYAYLQGITEGIQYNTGSFKSMRGG